MNDIRFIERKPNGLADIALGTDSVVPGVDMNTPLTRIHGEAIAAARSLRNLHRYEGYSMKGLKPVYFSAAEKEYIYG